MSTVYKIGIVAGVILIAGFAYYGISPLFRNIHIEDAVPTVTKVAVDVGEMSVTATSSAISAMKDSSVPVMGTVGHPASGTIKVLNAADGVYVRYENYKTINGPDLYVYVSKDISAKEFISLGEIRGTEGNINYKVPEGVSLKEYKYVLTWCKQFGVLFNSANVSSLMN